MAGDGGARRRQAIASGLLLLLLLAAGVAALVGCGGGRAEAEARKAGGPPGGVGHARPVRPFRFFAATSFWNMRTRATAELDPGSAPIVAAFAAEVETEIRRHQGPSINTTEYSVPVYTVPRRQPTVRVKLDAADAPALQAAWDAVPVPPDALPARGTDARLVIWQPSTDKLWEFWRAEHRADGWHASWGGAIRDVRHASGLPEPRSWPGAKPWWGSSGCSLGVVGGLITLEDLRQGAIDHALQIAIPNVRGGVFASPALRTDGTSADPLSLPEGAHLRLDPSLDLASLHLPPLTMMIARAAQRYGIYVINRSSDVSFQAEDPTRTGTDPYTGPGGFFGGRYPRELLAAFPWGSLQLLKMELHPYGR